MMHRADSTPWCACSYCCIIKLPLSNMKRTHGQKNKRSGDLWTIAFDSRHCSQVQRRSANAMFVRRGDASLATSLPGQEATRVPWFMRESYQSVWKGHISQSACASRPIACMHHSTHYLWMQEKCKCYEETTHIHASQHGPEQNLVACPDTYPLRHCGRPGQNGRFVFTNVSDETGIEEFAL